MHRMRRVSLSHLPRIESTRTSCTGRSAHAGAGGRLHSSLPIVGSKGSSSRTRGGRRTLGRAAGFIAGGRTGREAERRLQRAQRAAAMSLLSGLVGPGAKVNIKLHGYDERLKKEVSSGKGTTHLLPIYEAHEGVGGVVEVVLMPGKKLEHLGIKIELVGTIEMFNERGAVYEFTNLVKELETAGVLYSDKRYPFDFATVDKPYETYTGLNVRLRYFLRVTVTTKTAYVPNIVAEQDLLVQTTTEPPTDNGSIKMEVGIEDCLHIEFEYDKSKYHLKDVVLGKIYFLLVRIKIKHMELAIIRRESAGMGGSVTNESETLTKFEVMDGAPVRGECVPLRLFLSGIDLTPTYRSVNNRFSVKYYLNLVLVDEEDRRYFKQSEIIFWRKDIG